jgi:UDP-N-acetylmuramyl tripeptide synthase
VNGKNAVGMDHRAGAACPVPVRTRLAVLTGRSLAELSRRAGRGSGSVVGGHAILAIDRSALARLAAGRETFLVSGTNGKTTTTKLLASAVSSTGSVVTNVLGANLPSGLAAALAVGPPGAPAVLEVDEAWLPRVAGQLGPSVIALLNLSRDQLDRNNEVRQVAQRWRRACEEASPSLAVVANADDPLVAWAASGAKRVTWVGAGLRWKGDATGCPACGGQVAFAPVDAGQWGSAEDEPGGAWACPECQLSRPHLDVWLDWRQAGEQSAIVAQGISYPLSIGLPGRCNAANAAMALGAALASGRGAAASLAAMAGVRDVAGRYATVKVGHASARLLLAKNPAGWAEVFDMLAPAPGPVVVAINARTADGHDPSWLWDVPFEQLRGRFVVATGERGLDLAVRLHYAEVSHAHVPGLRQAVEAAAATHPGSGAAAGSNPGPVEVVANYTAFHQLLGMTGSRP